MQRVAVLRAPSYGGKWSHPSERGEPDGLGRASALPRRGPGSLLSDWRIRHVARDDAPSQGDLQDVRGARSMLGVGPRERSSPRDLGWFDRNRAPTVATRPQEIEIDPRGPHANRGSPILLVR